MGKHVFTGVRGMMLGVSLVFGFQLTAETVIYSKSGATDGNNQSSFNTGNGWEGGAAPVKDVSYVWNSTGNFRTRNRNWSAVTDTFVGASLTFTAGNIVLKTTNPLDTDESAMNLVVFPNLILSGLSAMQHSNDANTLARIGGSITVNQSFAVQSTVGADAENSHRDIAFLADFKSDSQSVVITVKQAGNYSFASCPNVVRLLGDNSLYKGKWSVKNSQASKTAEAMVLSVESDHALGDTPDVLMADAVTLSNNGALAISESLCEGGPFNPINRGITLEAPAGRLTTIGDQSWATTMPITGAGSLVKSGLGRVTLCGEYSAGDIAVESGTLCFASGFSAPNGMPSVSLSEGAGFAVSAMHGSVDVSGLNMPAGTEFQLAFGSTIVVGEGSTLPDGKIRASIARLPDVTLSAGAYELFKVHPSVRQLTREDFADDMGTELGPRRYVLDVRPSSDGMIALVADVCPLVKATAEATGDGSKWWMNTQKSGDIYLWDNHEIAQKDFDYLIDHNLNLRTANGAQTSASLEFPGESLTLYGGGTLALKSKKIVFKDLRLGPNTQVVASGYTSGQQEQTLAGRLTAVGAFDSDSVKLAGMRTQGIDLEAACYGSGTIQMAAYATSAVDNRTNVLARVSGDNSNFKGRFEIYSSYGNASTLGVLCRIADGANLGGPMASFTPNGISVRNNSGLMPEASMTLAEKNRGIYVGFGRFVTPENVDLTIGETLSLDGTLVKEGDGRLILDCPVRFGTSLATEPSGNNAVRVREGVLMPARSEAMKRLSVSFFKDGALGVDPEVLDDELKTEGVAFESGGSLSIPDGVLNIAVDMHGAKRFSGRGRTVPVCTVDEATASLIRGKIAVRRIRGARTIVREEALSGGRVRFWVDISAAGLFVIVM